MVIALTGFMGCGKSSVGKWLRTSLPSYELIDLDNYIVQKIGRSIPDIFAQDGEAAFRTLEADCLEEIIRSGKDCILALGGGAVMTQRCFDLVKANTECIYLKASPETIRQHLLGGKTLEEAAKTRPVLKGNGIEELMEKRGPVYEAVADHIVETDGRTLADIANEIFYLV